MKNTLMYLLIAGSLTACNNSTPAENTTANAAPPATAETGGTKRGDMYGKWSFKSAVIKMQGPDGKMLMNDTTEGGPDDYYIFKEDGTSISHIGRMQDTSHFKFISDNELVGAEESAKDSAKMKIISLTSSSCTISIIQKKASGSLDMVMFLKR